MKGSEINWRGYDSELEFTVGDGEEEEVAGGEGDEGHGGRRGRRGRRTGQEGGRRRGAERLKTDVLVKGHPFNSFQREISIEIENIS